MSASLIGSPSASSIIRLYIRSLSVCLSVRPVVSVSVSYKLFLLKTDCPPAYQSSPSLNLSASPIVSLPVSHSQPICQTNCQPVRCRLIVSLPVSPARLSTCLPVQYSVCLPVKLSPLLLSLIIIKMHNWFKTQFDPSLHKWSQWSQIG